MSKKNEKRLCWNCDGNVSFHHTHCPYCAVDLNQSQTEEKTPYQSFASPFQKSSEGEEQVIPNQNFASPFQKSPQEEEKQESIPNPPYNEGMFSKDFAVSEDEWNHALEGEKEGTQEEEDTAKSTKREMVALLLLLPGVVFLLFGIVLILFSHDGVLTLHWDLHLAYLYFLGAIPLLYLGWRAFR